LHFLQNAAPFGLIEDANADFGQVSVLMHPKVKRKLKQAKIDNYVAQATNQPYLLGKPIVSDAELESWLGYPFATTTAIRTNVTKGGSSTLSDVYVANFSERVQGVWGTLEILDSNVASVGGVSAFQTAQTFMRVMASVDAINRHSKAFVHVQEIETA